MDWLRDLLFKNLPLKLLALLSAFLLWFAIAREPVEEIALTVPVEFVNVPADLAITSENVPQTQIWVRGPQRLVRQVNPADLHPTVDLREVRIGFGERTFELTSGRIHAPRGVEVVQVIPAQLHLGFDRRITREVAVRPRVIGEMEQGVQITSVRADPPIASIIGPEKRVDAIGAVLTDPVDATGILGTASFSVSAYVPDPLVRVSTPGQVQVTITTEKINGGKK